MTKKLKSPILRRGKKRMAPTGGRKSGEYKWLRTQMNDPYTNAARDQGYRARSVYKLKFIQDKLKPIKSGMKVVDLGAAPGSWAQYAATCVGEAGKVIALDLVKIEPFDEDNKIEIIEGDAMLTSVKEQVTALLDDEKADVILSDMASKSTGIAGAEAAAHYDLLETVVDYCENFLANGGAVCIKLFNNAETKDWVKEFGDNFKQQKLIKPPAVRRVSSEVYFVGIGWKKSK